MATPGETMSLKYLFSVNNFNIVFLGVPILICAQKEFEIVTLYLNPSLSLDILYV